MLVRLAYLHFTLVHCKGQGCAHFDCEYLINGYKEIYVTSHGVALVYLDKDTHNGIETEDNEFIMLIPYARYSQLKCVWQWPLE